MSVPAILQNKPLRRPTNMNIQSEILYPIQFNQHSTRFVFDNKGVLDSNSRINLAVSINKTPQQDSAAVAVPALVGTDIGVASCDFVELEIKAKEISDGVASVAGSNAGGTTVVFLKTVLAPVITDGLKVGDILSNSTITDGTNASTITIIDTSDATNTTITVAPALGSQVNATNVIKFYSRTQYVVDALGGDLPSSVKDYYKGFMVKLGLQVPSDHGAVAPPTEANMVQGRITGYTSTDEAGGNILTVGELFSCADGTTALTTAQRKLTLNGRIAAAKQGCIYNPYSIVLGAAMAKTDGHWNGYDCVASTNVSPTAQGVIVHRYYAVGATALTDAPKHYIKVLKPVARVAYLSTDANNFKLGWVQSPATGGPTSVVMRLFGQQIKGMMPISTGVSSLIKRAVLTIGGREVSSLDSVGHFNTITNLLNSTEYRQKVLRPLEGVNDGMTFRSSQTEEQGFIGLIDGNATDTATISIPASLEIGGSLATTPRFSIPLSNLIPMMRGVKLPLFAINQEVSLLIEWAEDKDGHRICSQQPAGHTYEKTTIHEEECFMMCDYLYFEEEMGMIMDEIEQNDWSLPYEDVITIDAQLSAIARPLPATPHNFTKTETNTLLYLGGKSVRSIIIQKQSNNFTALNIGNNRLEGVYNSRGFQRPETYNLMIDNKPFYDNDLTLNGLHYQEFSRCFDTHLQIPNARYSMADMVDGNFDYIRGGDSGYITNKKFLGLERGVGIEQSRALTGNQNYFGINLGNQAGMGVKMSNLPVIFRHITERKATNDEYSDPITYKFYATIKRGMGIRRGGMVMVSD